MRQLLQSTHAYKLLRAESEENRLSNTYLLVLDDDRNLRFALKEFAKLFFSASSDERISRLIEEESYADCPIYPEKDKKFSVEDAEKIQEESQLKPVEGDKKVFVIGDFAEATVQAQNKLLKLLEEPPRGVYFLLGATVTYPVLQTVLSRSEKLEIPPFSPSSETSCLKRLYPNAKDVELCAAASGGSIGAAQNIIEGGYYQALLEDAFELAETDPFRLPSLVKRIGETKYKKELIGLLRVIFRDAMFIKTARINGNRKAEKYLMLRSERERINALSEYYPVRALAYAQDALTDAEQQIKFNAVFPQCLEICISKIIALNNK